jgi:hypothetical protein
LLDAALEGRTAFVSHERDRCCRPARIVNWHGEPAANAEMRRLVEESALRFRQTRRGEFLPPFEGLGRCQGLNDNRVDPLVALLQIVICPLDWVGRDQLWRFAPSRRQRKIGEAAQIECDPSPGENCSETFSVTTPRSSSHRRTPSPPPALQRVQSQTNPRYTVSASGLPLVLR